jgi:hypothetical protein
METVISTPHGGAANAEPTDRQFWQRCLTRIRRTWRSRDEVPDAAMLLPTYEATDGELRQLAEPVFRERIDQVRTEAFTRYVTGGG